MKKLMALLLALLTCFAAALADTASAPDIPQGTLNAEVMSFTPGQTYAVYSAPDSRSIRGAKGRARVSTNGWIQVFGAEGDWLLVQYAITPEHCRIGYIDKMHCLKMLLFPRWRWKPCPPSSAMTFP